MKVEMHDGKYRVVMGDNCCVVGGPYDTESEATKRIDEVTHEIIGAFEMADSEEDGLTENKVVKVITQLATKFER